MTKSLGTVLVEQGVIDQEGLQAAMDRQRATGATLPRAIVELGLADERQMVSALARELGMPFADTAPGQVDPQAAALLPRSVATELVALPVAFGVGNELVVAVADPSGTQAMEQISQVTGMAVRPALAIRADLVRAIEHLAGEDATSMPQAQQAGTSAPGAAPAPAPRPAAGLPPDPHPTPPPQTAAPQLAWEQEQAVDLDALLLDLLNRGGSDLHLTAGIPPTVRVDGELERLDDYPLMTRDELQKMLYGVLTQRQREHFENNLELDVSYQMPGLGRFRVNVFQQRESMGAVMRVIPFEIPELDTLGVPTQVANFAFMQRGFVLVTGPTGSGKSTTLAGLVDLVNRERACHIMTVEDPIEFLHRHKRAVVNQRELGTDTQSFAAALKHVLRQDPDVILVGEMRDLETIQVALTAAETGHLVFGTLHTQDAPQTVDRLIDVFPPHQQEQIRVMLAGALQGVLCQQLLRRVDGQGRVAACELMMATPAIRNLIREGKTHQMYSSIQAGKQHGMVAMDQSLAALVRAGKVSYDAALERCASVPDFNRLAGRD